MAKYGQTLAQVKVHINGREQAQKELDALKKSAEALGAQIDEANNRMLEASKNLKEARDRANAAPKGSAEETQATKEYLNAQHAFDEASKALNKYKTEKKQLDKSIRESEQLTVNLEEALAHLSEQDLVRLRKLRREVTAVRDKVKLQDDPNKEFLSSLNDALEKISDTIKNKSGQLTEFNDIMNNLGGASPKQLEDVQKRLEGLVNSVAKGTAEWVRYTNQLEKVNAEMAAQKKNEMLEQLRYISTLSENALQSQRRYWEEVKNGNKQTSAEYREAVKHLKELDKLESDRLAKRAGKVMAAPESFSVKEIQEAIKATEQLQNAQKPGSDAWKKYGEQIENAKNTLAKFKDEVKMEAMTAQFGKLDQLSVSALAEQKKYWQEVKDSAVETTNEYALAKKNLEDIKALEQLRLETRAKDTINQVASGQFSKTNEDTREAIRLLEEYKKQLETGNVTAIRQADEAIARLNEKLSQAKRSAAENVLSNLTTSGISQIKESIDYLSKYRDTLATTDPEWQRLGRSIQQATDYLKKFQDDNKMQAMTDRMIRLGDMSSSALEEQKKYWQSVVDGASRSDTELAKYEDNLRKVLDEEKRRKAEAAEAVMTNLDGSSVEQIRNAVKATEELRDSVSRSNPDWEKYNSQIENAKQYLAAFETEAKKAAALDVAANLDLASASEMKQSLEFLTKYRDTLSKTDADFDKISNAIDDTAEALKNLNTETKFSSMERQFGQLNQLSKSALAEQKKYWKEIMDSVEQTSVQYMAAESHLARIRDLENTRTAADATARIAEANSGNWDKTIEETQQAIKLIEEYKKQLKTQTDADAITEANEAIEKLNFNLGKAKEGLMDYTEAERIAKEVREGAFDGTAEEIEKAKKSLEAYRKTLKMKTGADKIKKVDKYLQDLGSSAAVAGKKVVNLDDVLGRLDSASFEELQAAAKQLQEQLDGAARNTAEYVESAADLRKVHLELKKVKKEWEGQENVIMRTVKRLASYILVYAGWNEVWGQLKQVYQANIELSDSLADIQKTTGLSAESVGHLSDQINAIDTRTAQKELHDLAYEAGKLGISAEEDVLAFVKAGNQLLVALGEDLGGAEAVRSLMKVNAILGETQELGVEKALLSTGSAINEISQTSRASAGPIADMVSRMGAIGSAAGLSMADLIALAGTADSLGQSAEVAATAFNKFIATLTSNPVDVAYALGMNPDQIQKQLAAGNTMQVIQDIFAKMSQMGNMADLAPIMGELGSEGARMTQVLVTMAKGVDELNAQVFTSNRAFEEATSVTNEYNIKNESAAAIVQRMGNNIREAFTNSTLVEWLREVLQWLYYIPNALERNRGMLLLVRAILWEIATVTLVKLVAMLKTSLVGALSSATLAWKSFYVQAAAAFFGIERNNIHWRRMTLHCLATTSAVGKLRIAFVALGKVIKANPIFFIGSVLAGVITMIQQLTDETNKAARAQAEFKMAVEKEKQELDNLILAINDANSANGQRAALIQQLNNKYGQYLGFLVTEENYLRNQEYIYKLLNAQIERSIALKMQEKLVSDVATKYADQQRSAYEDMSSALSRATTIGDTGSADAMSKIMLAIKEQVRTGVKDINAIFASIGGSEFKTAMEKLVQQYKDGQIDIVKYNKEALRLGGGEFGIAAYNDLWRAIKEMFDIETKISKEVSLAAKISKASIDTYTDNVNSIKQEEIDKIIPKIATTENAKELQEYQQKISNFIQEQKNSVKGLTAERAELNSLTFNEEKQLAAINEKLQKKQELTKEEKDQYDILLKKQNDEMKLSDDKEKQWQAVTDKVKGYEDALDSVNKKLFQIGGQSLWGPNENIADKSPQELAAMYEKLEKDASRLSKASFKNIGEMTAEDGKKYITQFWKNFDTRDKAIEWYKQQKATLAKQLDELGYTVRGKFKTETEGDSNRDQKSKARQDYQAAMSALKAYYNEYEDFYRQQREKNKITQEELNRQLLDNDRKYHEDRQQLIKKFLGEENTFDKTQYKGVLSDYDYFGDKDLDKMAEQYQRWGDAMTDGGRRQITESGVKIREALNKEQEKIKAELLKGDMFATFENNFAEMLDELGVLTSDLEDEVNRTLTKINQDAGIDKVFGLSPEERQQRVAELVKYADKSYQINEDQLRSLMAQNTQFALWANNLSDEDMTILLGKLRNYYDDRIALTKQYQDKLKKEFESYYEQIGKQAKYEEREQKLTDKEEKQSQLEGFGVSADYGDKRQNINDRAALEGEKIAESIEFNKERLKTLTEGSQEYLATQTLIAEQEQSLNDILAQSQRDLTQVYMDEWTKRAEKWGQVGEMFGDFLGEQLMLEKQANDARARGDLETAKKIEQQQKQNKQNLIKGLLNFIVDEATLWAKELALKMMFNAMSLADEKKKAIEEASLHGKQSILSIFLDALTGQAAEQSKGLPGLVTGAIIFAATMALQALAKSAIANMFPEAATGSTSNRKLSTGMLTYAEGNYPVLGNDGKVYDAKYEGSNLKTGVYGGGAHFGIFSEKQPEMIVDGKTTQKLILNYPYIYDAITTIAKNGRLVNAMPTFATGDYPAGMQRIAKVETVDASTGANEDMIQMRATMDRTNATIDRLSRLLDGGITAHLDGLENYKQQKKNERFLKRRGID